MDFQEALLRLGFRRREERTIGSAAGEVYSASPNRFLTYTVHAYDDGSALLTWEFAIADFLATKGMQIGAEEALNQYLYPSEDPRGPQEGAWLIGAVERAEAMLADVRLDRVT
ncbi:MAG TPA: hypothetical protein VIE12_03965 [Actinomycetota bacterium]